MFTSFLLGRLSDSVGRKPVLVMGNVAGTLSMLAFGLAGTFGQAAWSRFIGGLFNGVIGYACLGRVIVSNVYVGM